MNSDYRHDKHSEIAALLKQGGTNKGVARELGVNPRAVRRVRLILGLEPISPLTSLHDKLDRFSTEPDSDGHVFWTGRKGKNGTPSTRHMDVEISVASIAFGRRTGRRPVGTCRSGCGVLHCIADRHVEDDVERRTVRLLLRVMQGLPGPWSECRNGHSWDEEGRVRPDLDLYCRACEAARAAVRHRKP